MDLFENKRGEKKEKGRSDQDAGALLTPGKYAAVKTAAGKAHFSSCFLQCLFTYLNNLCH